MNRALSVALLGLVLLCAGLVLSPWPWLGFVVPGAVLAALGILLLFRLEVDE